MGRPMLVMVMNQPARVNEFLLYDGDCGFCQRWVEWAKRRGAEAAIAFLPCQSALDLRSQAGITEQQCSHSAFFVQRNDTGQVSVYAAAAAINNVLARLPGARNILWRSASALYRVPGLKQVEEIAYRVIARHRHRFGSAACKRQ